MAGYGPKQFRAVTAGAVVAQVTATVPSTTTLTVSFIGSVAMPGVVAGDIIQVAPVVAQTAGVTFDAQVTANDVIAITCTNASAGTYNPGSQVFNALALRLKLA